MTAIITSVIVAACWLATITILLALVLAPWPPRR